MCVSDASSSEQGCHKGTVLNLQTSVQDNGRQAQVLVEVPRSQNKSNNKNLQPLLLAQYVKVRFDGIELKNVFKLAPASVHDNKVWVNDGGELDIRPVNIAFRSAEYVLIDRGLNNGESIVTSNLGSPVNRMAIRTNESTPPSPTPAAVKP